jgi:hypothetical protein
MVRNVVCCDACGADKKDTNHWWASWIDKKSGEFRSAKLSEKTMNNRYRHACGSVCNGKFHQRWMATGTLEMEKPVPINAVPNRPMALTA